MAQPSPSSAPSPQASGRGSSNSGNVPPPLIPSSQRYAANRKQVQRVSLLLSVYLVVLLLFPEQVSKLFSKVDDFSQVSSVTLSLLATLLLVVFIARLTALLADGARLARALGAELSTSLTADSSLVLDLAVTDGFDESELFGKAGFSSVSWPMYWLVRTSERFLAHCVLIGVLAISLYLGIQRTIDHAAKQSSQWTDKLLFLALVVLLALSMLRLLQYQLVRSQGIFQGLEVAERWRTQGDERFPLPAKYSLTSVGLYIVVGLALIPLTVFLRLLQFVLISWKPLTLSDYVGRRGFSLLDLQEAHIRGDDEAAAEIYSALPTDAITEYFGETVNIKYGRRERFLRWLFGIEETTYGWKKLRRESEGASPSPTEDPKET